MEILKKIWEVIKEFFGSIFAKDAVINFVFRALEVVFAGLLGLGVFLVVDIWFTNFIAIAVEAIVFYFFSPIIKPYIDKARKWIISKITGVDCE